MDNSEDIRRYGWIIQRILAKKDGLIKLRAELEEGWIILIEHRILKWNKKI